MVWLL
jgi:hypothetical protein